MTDRKPIYVITNGADQPTSLAQFEETDTIPVVNGGTGMSSIAEATGFDYDPVAGTVAPTTGVTQVQLVGGGQLLLARSIYAANVLSAGPACISNLDGGVETPTLSATTSAIVSSCPVPNPVCYAQMDGDGTASQNETNFGAGVTPTQFNDSTNQITWNNTDKDFDIAADGTYHVQANLVFNVATTTLVTIKIKKGTTAQNTYVNQGIHSAEDPEHVGIQAAFTCSAGDTISVTFDDDGTTDVNLMQGSAVTVRRLY